jgi:3-oxoacyl-(acyl-carrier-protein) synthase
MHATADQLPVEIEACACVTPLGDAGATAAALLAGRRALAPAPVLGRDGGDLVPLALLGPMDETVPPRWLPPLRRLAAGLPDEKWGAARTPVVVTSSNFGVGSIYAFTRDHEARHLAHGMPFASVELLQREFGWGGHVTVFSHACVTAHLGLAHAARLLHAGLADRVLVFSFDFVSPFVAGGFHSLKILNGAMPAPYAVRETGSIGLGDGAGWAVLARAAGPPRGAFRIAAHALHNEMFHFTGNQPDGAGFAACTASIAAAAAGRRVWIKGHGTGTLEAGRLEAESFARSFPGAPLVSWKGSLGHTLGSCGLVELAVAVAALRGPGKTIPGTVGGASPSFTDTVALAPFASGEFDGAILTSNAFGGAHAALLLTHD